MGHYSTNGTIIHRAEGGKETIIMITIMHFAHASLFEIIIARTFSLQLISGNLPGIKNVVKRWLQDCCRKYWIETHMWLEFWTEGVGGWRSGQGTNIRYIPLLKKGTWVIGETLKMASVQVVETSATNNSPSQGSNRPGDLFQSRYVTPGFKPFLIRCIVSIFYFFCFCFCLSLLVFKWRE